MRRIDNTARLDQKPLATVVDVEVVAHRAGNSIESAQAASDHVDMIELDVHVFRGRVEVRHEKVLRPTRRLWEKWYLLPAGSTGVPIEDILVSLEPSIPLMIDLKCFTRRSSRRILRSLPRETPIVASARNWRVLQPFANRPETRCLRSCGANWQLWWVLRRSRFGANRGVCVHERRLTEPMIEALLQRSPLLFSWGATTAARVRDLERCGLTGVIVDDYSIAAPS